MPSTSGLEIRRRVIACGGAAYRGAWRDSTGGGPPSTGRMAASTTRPSSASPTGMLAPTPRTTTEQPSPTPATSPNGMSSARFFAKPTTSAVKVLVALSRISQDVPTATAGSVASTMIPETRVTLPAIDKSSTSATDLARRAIKGRSTRSDQTGSPGDRVEVDVEVEAGGGGRDGDRKGDAEGESSSNVGLKESSAGSAPPSGSRPSTAALMACHFRVRGSRWRARAGSLQGVCQGGHRRWPRQIRRDNPLASGSCQETSRPWRSPG